MAKARPIYVGNEPDLNLFERLQPEIYGRTDCTDIDTAARAKGAAQGPELTIRQPSPGRVPRGRLRAIRHRTDVRRCKAGACPRPPAAIHNGIRVLDHPVLEVHLSTSYAGESLRHPSYASPLASAVICGLKKEGSRLAVDALASLLKDSNA